MLQSGAQRSWLAKPAQLIVDVGDHGGMSNVLRGTVASTVDIAVFEVSTPFQQMVLRCSTGVLGVESRELPWGLVQPQVPPNASMSGVYFINCSSYCRYF